MCAQHVVNLMMFPFIEQIQIHFAHPRHEVVRVFRNKRAAVGKMFFHGIVKMLFASGERKLEQTFRVCFFHGQGFFVSPDEHSFRRGVINPDDHSVPDRVHSQHGMRIGGFSGKESRQCRISSNFFLHHANLPVRFSGGVRKC